MFVMSGYWVKRGRGIFVSHAFVCSNRDLSLGGLPYHLTTSQLLFFFCRFYLSFFFYFCFFFFF